MSAVPDPDGSSPRRSRFATWAADHDAAPPPAKWLFGEPNDQARELAELRERLADAERRAEEAEAALPHLLALGQRTVNGLLNDARARGRQIIEDAKAQAEVDAEVEREALQQEAKELDALRMAVAAEAMGLEQVRAELAAAVASAQLESRSRPALPIPGALVEPTAPAAPDLPPPPSPTDLAGSGLTDAPAGDDTPTTRFAEAWAADEDDLMVEAFDRFFAAEIAADPLRDAVLDEHRVSERG